MSVASSGYELRVCANNARLSSDVVVLKESLACQRISIVVGASPKRVNFLQRILDLRFHQSIFNIDGPAEKSRHRPKSSNAFVYLFTQWDVPRLHLIKYAYTNVQHRIMPKVKRKEALGFYRPCEGRNITKNHIQLSHRSILWKQTTGKRIPSDFSGRKRRTRLRKY